MTVDQLYDAYRKASEATDFAAMAEAEARVKQLKTRLAADLADKQHQKKYDEFHRASEKSRAAYEAYARARSADPKGGA